MSLRLFHLIFIAASVGLSVFLAGWAGTAYRADQGWLYAAAAAASGAAAVGLAAYGAAFQRKTRRLS